MIVNTALLLLGAGQSQRFNGIKQLADINGMTMLCHCLAQYRGQQNWLPDIHQGYVVIGAHAKLIKASLPNEVQSIQIDNWSQGMGTSIAKSIGQIQADTSHVLIGLADQVAVKTVHIQQLLNQSLLHPKSIIAAHYADRYGAPVIFPRQYFPLLASLSGDRGASKILNSTKSAVIGVDLASAEIDIDTQADWLSFMHSR